MRRTLALLAVAMLALTLTGSAVPANGDNLRTIIADRTGTACASYDAAGHHFSIGVGIAFDGTNLLISCYSDNTVTAINPADGSQVAVHSISGASSLGALAWDNGRGLLWACSGFYTVGTIDLTTNVFTAAFSGDWSNGCFDGLAYDAADDTIWASQDVSSHVEHWSVTGTLLSSTSISGLIGACGSSGIAVGGAKLYLANNGCSQIYEAAKDFSSSTLFASFPARLEDLECDNVTFVGAGKAAIWSIDAYDNILNAWEIPTGACLFGGGGGEPPAAEGRMTGGGSVFTAAGARVTHGFELHCDASKSPNNLQVNWGKGNRFHLTSLTSAACSDDGSISEGNPVAGFDTYKGKGTGNYNGMLGATAEWTFTDAGEPGSADSVTLTIKDAGATTVLTVTGTLNSGNQQAHAD